MKQLIFSIAVLSLFSIQAAMACPANCTCDVNGKVISRNTNTVNVNSGNTTHTINKNTYNTDSSFHPDTESNAAGGSAEQHQQADAEANGNVTHVTENYHAPKIPVSTAYAAGLTSGFDTCLGSLSGGAQTMPVGISFGGTKEDRNCIFIKKAHLIGEHSPRAECFYIRAHDKDIDDAYKQAGIDCPPEVPPAMQANDVVYATVDDLREVEKRIFTRTVSK